MDCRWLEIFVIQLHVNVILSAINDNWVQLDLKLGLVTGYSPYIKFIQRPTPSSNTGKCSIQSVVQLNFTTRYKAASFQLYYGRRPKLWTFHLSDSEKGRGNGGSASQFSKYRTSKYSFNDYDARYASKSGHNIPKYDELPQENDAELRIYNRQFHVFGNSVHGLWDRTNKGQGYLLKKIDRFIRKSPTVVVNISDYTLNWRNRNRNRNKKKYKTLKSDFLFSMYDNNVPTIYRAKGKDYIVYAGFNRVVAGNFRSGSGLCGVRITLYADKHPTACETGNHNCHRNAVCVPGRRSYSCRCKDGYFGTGIRCKENDECKNKESGCVHICVNTPGNYTCKCHKGFELASDGHNCIDKNECLEKIGPLHKKGGCDHQCRNNIGSHECLCNARYYLHSDGLHCLQGSWCRGTGCQHYCRNVGLRIVCACRRGYILGIDRKSCIRTCSVGNGGCQHICRNTVRKVTCSCAEGYRLQSDNRTCIASCGINKGGCSKRCNDSPTGPVCSCPQGYKLHSDGKTCLDINECAVSNGGCSHTCVNTKGDYECVCPQGYKVREIDKQCVDVNECEINSTCDYKCINTVGSYRCECKPGFQLYGLTHCADKNECSENRGGCQFRCKNTIGGYECPCPHGYRQHANKKDCSRAIKCVSLKIPAKAEIACRRESHTEICELRCTSGARFTEVTQQTVLTYKCGFRTRYMWRGPGVDKGLPSCSATIEPPDLKRKATFYFRTPSHCTMKEKTKSLFNRSLINNILDRSRYSCNGQCRLKDIEVSCKDPTSKSKYARSRRVRKKHGRGSYRGFIRNHRSHREYKGVVVAHFDLEVMPSSVSDKCNVDCIQRKSKRKLKKLIKKLRRYIRKKDFIVMWDNERFPVHRSSFRAKRIKLSCKIGQVLVGDKCVSCSEGKYYDQQRLTCDPCPSGTYQDSEGQLDCKPCPNQNRAFGIIGAKNRSECESLCTPGYYSIDGAKPCVPCSKGTYQPDYGRTSCIKCGENIDTSGQASTGFHQCIVADFCRAGHYYSKTSHKCHPCPRGTYQSKRGQNFCTSCPGKTQTDDVAALNASYCKDLKCGGYIGRYQGYVESPNFPGDYPAGADCRWTIKSEKNRRILIVIPEIFLTDEDNCGDQLAMRKTMSASSLTSYETCSTSRRPVAFTASTRRLTIRFRTNERNASSGFSIPYVTYNKEYQGLIDDIVNDQKLYSSYQHQEILKNRKLLSSLLDVIAVPHRYYKYANATDHFLPKSFIRLLRTKITRFLS